MTTSAARAAPTAMGTRVPTSVSSEHGIAAKKEPVVSVEEHKLKLMCVPHAVYGNICVHQMHK